MPEPIRGGAHLFVRGGFPRGILGKKGSAATISAILVMVMASTAMGAGLLVEQATFVSHPFIPCQPYFVVGNITLVTNTGARTLQANTPVWINSTYLNGTNGGLNASTSPMTYSTHTDAGGQYQLDLPCGYVSASPIKLSSHDLAGSNASAYNATSVNTAKPGSYLDGLLKAPALAAVLTATPTSAESPLITTLTTTHTGGNGKYSFRYILDFGGLQATEPNGSFVHTYTFPTTHWANVSFWLNDSYGDSLQSNNVLVKVVPPVSLTSFLPSLVALNNSEPETFTATVVNGAPNYNYAYQSGTNINPTHTGIASTTDSATIFYKGQASSTTGSVANVTVTDSGGKSTSGTTTVWVYNLSAHANLGLSYRPADAGQTIQFNGTAMGGGNYYAFHWQFGDGAASSSTLRNPTHAYAASGTYTARFWANDSGHSCGAACPSTTLVITVNPAMIVTLTANRTTIDANQGVSFTETVTSGTGTTPYTSYYTNFGNAQHATSPSSGASSTVYAAGGPYTAQGAVVDSANANVSSNAVTITVSPTLSVTGSITNTTTHVATTQGYVGETLDFTSAGAGGTPGYTYGWIFGDGSSTTFGAGTTTTHAYAVGGTYTVTFEVKDSVSGYATTTAAITIYAALSLNPLVSNRTAGEISLSVQLTDSWAGGTVFYHTNWTFGDGTTFGPVSGTALTDVRTHVYTTAANVTVGVVTRDSQGEQLYRSLRIFVYNPIQVTLTPTFPSGNSDPPLNVTYSVLITGGSFGYVNANLTLGDGNRSVLIPSLIDTETYWHAGHYNASIWVRDNASDKVSVGYSLAVWGQNYTESYGAGWSLVALPGIHTNYDLWFLYEALVQSGASPTTTQVAIQNTAGGLPHNWTFQAGVAGSGAAAPHAIADARGIWIYLALAATVKLSAAAPFAGPLGTPTTLLAGWNNLGWVLSGATTASGIAALIPSASTISVWNPGTQSYTDYVVGFDTVGGPYDSAVANGQGFLVWVPSATSFTE